MKELQLSSDVCARLLELSDFFVLVAPVNLEAGKYAKRISGIQGAVYANKSLKYHNKREPKRLLI